MHLVNNKPPNFWETTRRDNTVICGYIYSILVEDQVTHKLAGKAGQHLLQKPLLQEEKSLTVTLVTNAFGKRNDLRCAL